MHACCKTAIAVVGCLASFSAGAQDDVAAQDDLGLQEWHYDTTYSLWAAGLHGHVGTAGANANIEASFQDLAHLLNVGMTLRVNASRPPVAWFIEANYLGYDGDSATTTNPVRVAATQTFAESGLSYELNPALAVYGGLRVQQIDSTTDIPNVHREATQNWLDGIVGLRWTPFTSSAWTPWMRCDMGGGASHLVWLAEAGTSYRWSERAAAHFAYRVLDTDYGRNGFTYDVRQRGLLLGVDVSF